VLLAEHLYSAKRRFLLLRRVTVFQRFKGIAEHLLLLTRIHFPFVFWHFLCSVSLRARACSEWCVHKQNRERAERYVVKPLRKLVLFTLLAVGSISWADGCEQSLAVLASSSDRESVSLEEQLMELASLYSLVVNDGAPREVFDSLLSKLADREKSPVLDMYKEIELLAASPAERKAQREEREERKRVEQSRFLEGLEPYLSRIGRKHREVIEETLIRPGLVNPLIVGEVEFKFAGTHWFVVGGTKIF
jgi:hypothetical protein